MARKMVSMDGNNAVAHVAHAVSEVCAIYPITPSSVMGEVADEKSARGLKNIWGTIPTVVELQSEGGASGAVHGALTAGALSTTFTASQGLLLMIPNMFKIAGELTPAVIHVSARAVAVQALSIFGDHSDVMACRSTGFGMTASGAVQEAMDMALISHAATLKSRIPFVHFFDGFRTSHEVQKIEELTFDDMRAMMDADLIKAHRERGLNPEHPTMRGTAQNPDVYFQGRESANAYYSAAPGIVQEYMDRFAKLTGRQYHLFDYVGAPDAERVIVIMGSGADVAHEVVENFVAKGEKVGLVKVRLYRPFSMEALAAVLPATTKKIAVMDRTKEPGSLGEPLYQDVRNAIGEALSQGKATFKEWPKIVGGRYGLGSKEFNPGQIKAIFDNLAQAEPKNKFTVGINEDRTKTSLPYNPLFSTTSEGTFQGMFYGLGSDGTIGANKNSIKIIGDATANYCQGYFVYDSKKAGSMTVSHLRFGKHPIHSPYLITAADFIACHAEPFLEKFDMLAKANQGATFLLNSQLGADKVWDSLPYEVQKQIIDKKLKFYVINAYDIAKSLNLGPRINTIMMAAFFKISKVIDVDLAIKAIKDSNKKTYGKKGEEVVMQNNAAVDGGLEKFEEVKVPAQATSKHHMKRAVPADAPDFIQNVTGKMIAGLGDEIPTSVWPEDGTFPTGTTKYEKRNIALEIPVWDPDVCLQCAMCSLVCPHASIRIKLYKGDELAKAPATFKSIAAKGKGLEDLKYTVQTAPEDCTGCGACVHICPGKNKTVPGKKAINMDKQEPLRESEAANYEFFLSLSDAPTPGIKRETIKGSQLITAMFEYSGACAGCGETPYVKLMSQLFGDRAMIANATGCSSIYGGNLPTTPYCTRKDGRGPAWSNSLFEDNAEFGYGMRLCVDKQAQYAQELIDRILETGACKCPDGCALLKEMRTADQSMQEGIEAQRLRVAKLKQNAAKSEEPLMRELLTVAESLIKRSVWIVGGDGWAYDIGYGGLDHVLASGKNVNVLVLDTEVYSNTGGQMSKATPMGAVAQFAAGGKGMPKRDLGMISMTYGNIYVATVAMGANPAQCVRAFMEAESYDGPSIVIAYSTCIAHGIDMTTAMDQMKKAVACGHWPLYRFDPRLIAQGKNPLQLDTKELKGSFQEYVMSENRYRILAKSNPEASKLLCDQAAVNAKRKFAMLQHLAALSYEAKAE
ncbi:MAG: pyruvate:ferredoxin (flavodoxin) oxidoreductase [Candidatus Sumerlaeota bacterium]|nr:pyruvate:ferredoxin (flavodoxin) oxidoreductase [Candidatus Sumerlaeota bacterium]